MSKYRLRVMFKNGVESVFAPCDSDYKNIWRSFQAREFIQVG